MPSGLLDWFVNVDKQISLGVSGRATRAPSDRIPPAHNIPPQRPDHTRRSIPRSQRPGGSPGTSNGMRACEERKLRSSDRRNANLGRHEKNLVLRRFPACAGFVPGAIGRLGSNAVCGDTAPGESASAISGCGRTARYHRRKSVERHSSGYTDGAPSTSRRRQSVRCGNLAPHKNPSVAAGQLDFSCCRLSWDWRPRLAIAARRRSATKTPTDK